MRLIASLLLFVLISSCKQDVQKPSKIYKSVEIQDVYNDSLSIRAIELMGDGTLAFAADKGTYGLYFPKKEQVATSKQLHDSVPLHFRAVAHTSTDFFMLSIESPALLYKTGDDGSMKRVYKEEGEEVFYDAMTFWNDKEGIAVGDSVNGCLSIIITRDGGETWAKLPCENLPKAIEGEGAFAASNTNIKVLEDKAWIATTSGTIYYSENKGETWITIETPMQNTEATQGVYSIDFYDELNGFAIGGDYTKPDVNTNNKMKTVDGGKTWLLVADGEEPGYKSCVQYMPNRNAESLVAVGFNGISMSNDHGESWKQISEESFYTIRFLNDSIAYAAGKGRISKLVFTE
ncbi:oxidoreductase [Formosa agariphila KMM 3901]|uniref:Oxidoreductase n=1 Tax=Formosa agariphila (strain DSM 15362 / KCTC 12365 / LMG 23005 / KMM 3901 / M-2Alg 35-1) TaxID=1347342 RepID=T2KJ79_FORAG|nr:oxidoreductase [Formosa agariphila]CDF78493.1 oxidoreductase [Formosa agariphila KMM 3901]